MEFITDIQKSREVATAAIKAYGYAPEHNVSWYLCNTEPTQQAVVIYWQDGKVLLTHREKKEWYIFSEPVMPLADAGAHVIEFAEIAFQDANIKK